MFEVEKWWRRVQHKKAEREKECLKTINTYKFYPLSDDGDLHKFQATSLPCNGVCGIIMKNKYEKLFRS